MDVTTPKTPAAGKSPKRAMSDTWYSILLIAPAMIIILFLNGLRWFRGVVRNLLILPLATAPAAVGR